MNAHDSNIRPGLDPENRQVDPSQPVPENPERNLPPKEVAHEDLGRLPTDQFAPPESSIQSPGQFPACDRTDISGADISGPGTCDSRGEDFGSGDMPQSAPPSAEPSSVSAEACASNAESSPPSAESSRAESEEIVAMLRQSGVIRSSGWVGALWRQIVYWSLWFVVIGSLIGAVTLVFSEQTHDWLSGIVGKPLMRQKPDELSAPTPAVGDSADLPAPEKSILELIQAPPAKPVDPATILGLSSEIPQTAEALNKEAFETCEKLIGQLPHRPEPYALAAFLYNRHGRSSEAESHWQKAIEINPHFAPAYTGLGLVAADRGDFEAAIRHLRKAVQLDPYAGQAHSLLVDVLLRQSSAEEALAAARQYVSQFPLAADSHYWLGQALLELRRDGEAKSAHEMAVKCDPTYTAAYHSLAMVCARLGLREESRQWRQKFQELKEKDLEADRARSRHYLDLPQQQKLAASYHFAAGNVHASFGDPQKAEAHWLRGSAIAPQSVDCRLALAEHYERQDRLFDSLEQWEALVRIAPETPGYWYRKGKVETRLGQFDAAEQSLRSAIEKAPQWAEPYTALVDLSLQYGHSVQDLIKFAETAAKLAATVQNYLALAAVRDKSGDRPGAIAAVEEALKLQPDHPLLGPTYETLLRSKNER